MNTMHTLLNQLNWWDIRNCHAIIDILKILFPDENYLYYHGYLSEDERSDPARAFTCFMKSALTYATGDALLKLGDMYRYGQYVSRDEDRARGLYLMADRTA